MPYGFNDMGGTLGDLVNYPPGYDPKTGTFGHNFLAEGMAAPPGGQPVIPPNVGGNRPPLFLPNITQQIPRQIDPMQQFLELLRQFQGMGQPQQMPQMPDFSRILQQIGPIMQQIGPLIRSFQQQPQAQPIQTAAPSDTTTAVPANF
jgi:hypothetical protein